MALQKSDKKFNGRVIVVDDNWITLKLIEKMLESFGLVTVVVDSGAAALELLKSQKFDLLFLDCMMPELDGFAVAREIRTSEKQTGTKRMHIVAFTGDDSIENRNKCREAGMDAMFAKPYSYTSLEELLGKLMEPAT